MPRTLEVRGILKLVCTKIFIGYNHAPTMNNEPPLLIMGDIHGHLENLKRHLRYAGLANSNAQWTGGNAQLWFMGDFTDRGPDGVGVLDFVMRLQEDAANQGGHVGAILGNHDAVILSAKLFPHAPTNGPEGTFYDDWVVNGGTISDLAKLDTPHIDWMMNLPALAVVQNRLLLHADAMFYLVYGDTLDGVNATITDVLHSRNPEKWDELLAFGGQRLAFDERKSGGVMRASELLAYFGGRQIIHGHTPIYMLSGEPLERITRAYTYCDGLAIDVDGGIYKGGAGFVYEAPLLEQVELSFQIEHKHMLKH